MRSSLTILHVDMDAFYAAVEALDHPEWRGLPLVVGADPRQRGVVSTCSYEARAYGVHSAMPSRTAGRLCPHAVFVRPRMERYAEVSRRIMDICFEFTPLVEPLSSDEAFLDVSGAFRLFGDAVVIAKKFKARVKAITGLTASVGVASNKLLAKIASDMHKPDGLTVAPVTDQEIMAFLAPLPVDKMWGIGKTTTMRLRKEGLRLIGQLQSLDRSVLKRLFGATGASDIYDLVRGRDHRPVEPTWDEKSLSHEWTFPRDESDIARVRQALLQLTMEVGRRLRASGKRAKTARIKLRYADFSTITRQKSFPGALNSDRRLIACAMDLFDGENVQRPVRLVGFGVNNLTAVRSGPVQDELFRLEADAVRDVRDEKVDCAVDALRNSFGNDIIVRGDWRR